MYPLMIDLSTKRILIVGGGTIALRKAKGLLQSGGKVELISPTYLPEILELSLTAPLKITQREFQKGDTKGFDLIFLCTNQEKVNQAVLAEIKPYQWVNDTMNKQNGNFHNMAFFEEEDIGIAITSFGKAPAKTKKIKENLIEFLQSRKI